MQGVCTENCNLRRGIYGRSGNVQEAEAGDNRAKEDRKTAATARIQAARSLLEYGLRLTETVDVMKQLNELEQWRDKVDGND